MPGERAFFAGGPLDGQIMTVEDWPFRAIRANRQAIDWSSKLSPVGMSYDYVLYYPATRQEGLVIAITEEHMRVARRHDGLDAAIMHKSALTRLYNAITGDHNDPTDESGTELEQALNMAEMVLSAVEDEVRLPNNDRWWRHLG